MSEIKRDAAADLAMCEAATPGPWFTGIRGGQCHKTHEHGNGDCVYDLVLHLADDWVEATVPGEEIFEYGYDAVRIKRPETAKFMAESREVLPHWINRAVAAEAEAEKYRSMWFDLKEEIKQRMDASFDHFHVLQSLLGEMCIRESSFGK